VSGWDLRAFACIVLVGLLCISVPGGEIPERSNPVQPVTPLMVASPPVEKLGEALDLLGYGFVENLGQVENARIRYYAEGKPLSIGVVDDGLVFVQDEAMGDGTERSATSKLTFEGGHTVEPVGRNPSGRLDRFFIGDDPTRWVRGARTFREVVLEHVYDGVDIRFY